MSTASKIVIGAGLVLCVGFAQSVAVAQSHYSTPAHEPSNPLHQKSDSRMKIQLTAGGTVIATATLDDNATARDFAALLPLNLPFKDYAATEKIADLPHRLSVHGAPRAYTPLVGDISFYAPWGNLAIFYKNGELSSGLVRIGRIDAGLAAVQRLGPVSVRVERISP